MFLINIPCFLVDSSESMFSDIQKGGHQPPFILPLRLSLQSTGAADLCAAPYSSQTHQKFKGVDEQKKSFFQQTQRINIVC